jgi:nicotinamidase-related amidase
MILEAFIIIDMQDGYIGHKRGTSNFGDVVEYINYVSSLFRKEGRPVIFVRDISEGDSKEFCTIHELISTEKDHEILKCYNNSFWETGLEKLLNELKVDMVVLAGSAAEFCVSATYFGALERGYNPVLLQNGILSETIEGYQAMIKTKPLIAYQPLKYLLINLKH